MQEQLIRFLKVINLDETYFNLFENYYIERVKLNHEDNTLDIYINAPYLLDVRIYDLLDNLSATNYQTSKINLFFKPENKPTDLLIKEYFNYFLNKEYKSGILYESLINLPFEVINNEIFISTNINTLFDTLEPLLSKISTRFNSIGLNYTFRLTNLNNENNDAEEMFEQLQEVDKIKVNEESKKQEYNNAANNTNFVKQENTNFYAKDYKQVHIEDLEDYDTRVEIIGKIFAIDEKETRNKSIYYNIYMLRLHRQPPHDFRSPFHYMLVGKVLLYNVALRHNLIHELLFDQLLQLSLSNHQVVY